MTFKSILTSVLFFSLIFSAEAMYVYSNQAAKDNVAKHKITSQNVSGWSSLAWIVSHEEKDFPVDSNWEVPSFEQSRADGLSFTVIMEAIEDGRLNSQSAYDELVQVNKLNEFHSKNIKYRFGQSVKTIGLIIVLILSLLLLKRIVKGLNKKWKSIKLKRHRQSIPIGVYSGGGSIQKGLLLLSAGMLLISVINLPYGYYTFLRFIVTLTAVTTAYCFYKTDSNDKVVIFSLIALLFNPVVPVHLNKPLWLLIDIGIAIYMYSVSMLFVQVDKNKIQ